MDISTLVTTATIAHLNSRSAGSIITVAIDTREEGRGGDVEETRRRGEEEGERRGGEERRRRGGERRGGVGRRVRGGKRGERQ